MENNFNICIICFQTISNNCQACSDLEVYTGLTLYQSLLYLFSALDLSVNTKTVLCIDCFKIINIFYCFKNQCYEIEERINNHLEMINYMNESFNSTSALGIVNCISNDKKKEIKVEVDLEDETFNLNVCRTCLQTITNTSHMFSLKMIQDKISIYDKLCICCPEVDLRITPEMVLCKSCFDKVNAIYQFQTRCFESEIQINEQINNCLENIKTEIKVEEISIDETEDILDIDMVDTDYKKDHYFVCCICGYKTKTNLFSYLTQLNIKPKIAYMEINNFKCVHCKHNSGSKINMNKETLPYTDIKLFVCGKCKYYTSQKSNMKKHLLLHASPFKCSFCGYATNEKDIFNQHMLTHSKKRIFKCKLCGYTTVVKSDMQKHLITKEHRKFKCKFCNYSANDLYSFKQHLQERHENVL